MCISGPALKDEASRSEGVRSVPLQLVGKLEQKELNWDELLSKSKLKSLDKTGTITNEERRRTMTREIEAASRSRRKNRSQT